MNFFRGDSCPFCHNCGEEYKMVVVLCLAINFYVYIVRFRLYVSIDNEIHS